MIEMSEKEKRIHTAGYKAGRRAALKRIAERLRDEGKPLSEIGEIIMVSEATVRALLKEA